MARSTASRAVLICALSATVLGSAQTVDLRLPKRLIATGWDNPDQVGLKEHVRVMETHSTTTPPKRGSAAGR